MSHSSPIGALSQLGLIIHAFSEFQNYSKNAVFFFGSLNMINTNEAISLMLWSEISQTFGNSIVECASNCKWIYQVSIFSKLILISDEIVCVLISFKPKLLVVFVIESWNAIQSCKIILFVLFWSVLTIKDEIVVALRTRNIEFHGFKRILASLELKHGQGCKNVAIFLTPKTTP